jgi:hypothetical protein
MASAAGARAADDAVKPGQWEFQTQLQGAMPELPPGVSLPPGIQPAAGAAANVSHRQCIEPDEAVPSDPRRNCKVDRIERSGNVINWTTTCQVGPGTVVSTGTARYAGDTMEANLNVRAPNGRGGTIETKQHITGRYLGPCPGR